MKKAFIYPITNRDKKGVVNPYLYEFTDSLKENIKFVNLNSPSNVGVINIFKYSFSKLDYIFLNWIEDLPDKKLGKFQTFLLVYFIFTYSKFTGTKIIWTLHNKLSHYKSNIKTKKWLFEKLIKKSDFILTHAREGIKYIEEFSAVDAKKVHFFHHPVRNLELIEKKHQKIYDLIIWGTILPYKGVAEFLESWNNNKAAAKYKILIAGKVPDTEYLNTLENLLTKNIELRKEYIPNEELAKLIHSSKAILFTYQNNSILSSGALMDSIVTGEKVIGPETGAFVDLKNEGLVDTYENFEDIPTLLKNIELSSNISDIKSFFTKNNWNAFGKKFYETVEKSFV